jgi:NADPH2:quinone reductase
MLVRRTTTLLPAAVRLTGLLPSPASRAAPAVARIATVATVEERPDVSTVPTTMKHITYTPGCAAEGLTLTESPVPEVGDGEVLIRVAYAGMGGTDLAQRAGKFNPKPDAPAHHLIMGLEVSGVVARCGAGVSDFRPGDRVASLLYGACMATRMHPGSNPNYAGGGCAEYCVAPQAATHITQAAGMPSTAWRRSSR